jgi:hypothetical protein
MIRAGTHYHPRVVSNLSLVTTSDGEIANKLNKAERISIVARPYHKIRGKLDNETHLADVWADRIRRNWLCEAEQE